MAAAAAAVAAVMTASLGDRWAVGVPAGTVPARAGAVAGGYAAVAACAAMAAFYVAILYSPTLVLRLPPPSSLRSFMLRRFACAAVSSSVSITATAFFLTRGRGFGDVSALLGIYGIRKDHALQAVVYPLLLTSLMYAGSLVLKLLLLVAEWKSSGTDTWILSYYARRWLDGMRAASFSNILAWRNFVVAPITEEIVFRACMIPLLLCEGYKLYNIIFFSPIFFSLAHLNHFMELYYQQNYSFVKACCVVGLQLCYTVIFGWYASFLFIRTGNLIPPVVAHVFCNFMGLPVVSSSRARGVATIAFLAGSAGFFGLLCPLTSPELYNIIDAGYHRSCWCGICHWIQNP